MAMYANLLENHVAGTRVTAGRLTHGSQSVAVVDSMATVAKSEVKWAIALVNRHPAEAVDCMVKMGGKPLHGGFKAAVLAGDSPEACNDIGRPDRVKPEEAMVSIQNGVLRLPPHSVMIMKN
jgi:alpha-L-arabinofuranosidase